MEPERITLPLQTAGGEVTTFYSYDSGAVRSSALASSAFLLAGRAGATTPVLMIDWDTTAPSLDSLFDADPTRPGLLEWAAGLLLRLGEAEPDAAHEASAGLAGLVLEALDWNHFVQRVDQGRPLYLMSAGAQDSGYGERAAAFDWQALFYACPSLFQAMMVQLRRHFTHVLVNAPCGRTAATSICTALLPRKLVTVFLPTRPSLEGACGVVARAVEARCAIPLEQRPLLIYPLPAAGCDDDERARWESVIGAAFGMARVSLEAWFSDGDNRLAWIEAGDPPWLSRRELALQQAVASGRQADARGAACLTLSRDLFSLGELCEDEGRLDEARDYYQESMELRQRLLGDAHAETRSSRFRLAGVLRACGRLAEARFLYEVLVEDGERLHGAGSRAALSARAGLAGILGQVDPEGEGGEALDALAQDCETCLGASDPLTLDCLLAHAIVLARTGEPGRARILVERVLDVRWRQLGSEHPATLAAMEQLAVLLLQAEDQSNAVRLQQQVVDGYRNQFGERHPGCRAARNTLAALLSGEMPAADGLRYDTNGRAELGLLQVKSAYENSDQQ
jgi:tetratricopeptide (TPR) repeat protein